MSELQKIIVFDVVCPGIVGLAVYFGSKEKKEALMALITALVSVAISLNAQLLVEHHHTREALAEEIGLNNAVTSNEAAQALKNLGQQFAAVLHDGDETSKKRAREIIRSSVDQIDSIAKSRFVISARETDFCGYIVSSMHNVRRSVFATSLVGGDFWNSDCGRDYMAANIAARKRQPPVDITRVFILDNEAEAELLKPTVAEQFAAHIHVRITCDVDPLLQRDFAIFDEHSLMSIDLAPKSQIIAGIEYEASPGALERAKAAQDQLMRDSTEISNITNLSEVARSRCS